MIASKLKLLNGILYPKVSTWLLNIVGVITGKIYPSADSTTAVQFTKADGTTPIITVDSTNSFIGIGITTPQNKLHQSVTGAVNNLMQFTNTSVTGDDLNSGLVVGILSTGDAIIYHQENKDLIFTTNSNEILRLFSDRSISINHATKIITRLITGFQGVVGLTTSGNIQSTVTDNAVNLTNLIACGASTTTRPVLNFIRSRGTKASPTYLSSGDVIGEINFTPFCGAANRFQTSAKIMAIATSESDGGLHSDLIFSVSSSSSGQPELCPALRIIGRTYPTTANGGAIVTKLGAYKYSLSAITLDRDTINDCRELQTATTYTKEICTVASSIGIGTGTWKTIENKYYTSLTDSNELEPSGSYIDLPTGKSGSGTITFGDGIGYAIFLFTSAGVVTLLTNTSNIFSSLQTGTNHVIIKDNGVNVRIVNELGATTVFNVTVNYTN